jgi:uncharacterized delta-60 repeat protein
MSFSFRPHLAGRLLKSSSGRHRSQRTRSPRFEALEDRSLFAVVLDPYFGSGGKITTDLGQSYNEPSDMEVQQDGRIVVLDGSSGQYQGKLAIARYEADGDLDPTFGTVGIDLVKFPTLQHPDVHHFVLQPDGKIVAAGTCEGGLLIARLTSAGALDPTFNGSGVFVGAPGFTQVDVALQGDGKIVIGGLFAPPGGNQSMVVGRFTKSGSLDTAFAQNGFATRTFASNSIDVPSVLIQPDGKILVGGTVDVDQGKFDVLRYTTTGALDTTFGVGGRATIDTASNLAYPTGMALQPDGRIVVAGYDVEDFFAQVPVAIILTRLTSNGATDKSFSGDGLAKAAITPGGSNSAFDVQLQEDGKIVVVGGDGLLGIALYRFNASGTLDKSFDGDGKQSLYPDTQSTGFSLRILDDGSLLIAGEIYAPKGSTEDIDAILTKVIETKPVLTSFVVPTSVALNERVHLSALAHDVNQSSATLIYTWTITGPGGFKAKLTGKNATFVASVKGNLKVSLVVLDREGLTATMSETVNVG